MEITDNQLCMIEQLCYLNKDVAEAAGVSGFNGIKAGQSGMTIAEILACFDEEALQKLEAHTEEVDGACASGSEWAAIIRYLKSSALSQFVLSDTMTNSNGTTLALCFTKDNNSSEAIVAFKGTSGGEEWIDNVEGLNAADTDCQKEALDYIESLPYDNITVTGHSKGGNKAMYVAITSDKVDRCVAYDGQGFSQEFIDKYWAEIEARGKNITNYSLSTDYVHTLMFPIPNSNQVYCEGYGVENIKQHHSPNSFFVTDKNGNLILDEDGNPQIVITGEDESMQMLHEFTTFVINNANDTDKVEIVDFVSQLLAMVFGGGEMDTQAIIDYALANTDTFALIIAYLVKYMEVNDLSSEDIDKLLTVLGLDSLDDIFSFSIGSWEIIGLAGLIDFMKKQLTDNDDDWLITKLLQLIKIDGYDFDISEFWQKINGKVKTIDTSGGSENATNKTGTIRDFSAKVYDTLLDAISRIEAMGSTSVSFWSGYSGEDWYSSLLIGIAIKGINAYFAKLSETNQTCKTRIENIFSNVGQIDSNATAQIQNTNADLQSAYAVISGLASSIG